MEYPCKLTCPFVAHPVETQNAGTQTSIAEDENGGGTESAVLSTPAQPQDELASLRAAVRFLLAKGYGMYCSLILLYALLTVMTSVPGHRSSHNESEPSRAIVARGIQTTPYPGFNNIEEIYAYARLILPRDKNGDEYVEDSEGLEELPDPKTIPRYARLWRLGYPSPRYPGSQVIYQELRRHPDELRRHPLGEDLPLADEIVLQERVRQEYLRRLKDGLVPVPPRGLKHALRSYCPIAACINL